MAILTKTDKDASDLPALLNERVERERDEQERLRIRLRIAKDELAVLTRKATVWKFAFDELAEAAEAVPGLAEKVEALMAQIEIDLIGAEVHRSDEIPPQASSYIDPFERPLGG